VNVTEPTSLGRHVTDEDLLLDFYGESAAADRAEREAHLASCEACRALDRETRAVLALIDTTPTVDAPEGFGREMWARVEPEISARMTRTRTWWLSPARWALAGGMAVLVIGSFLLGRVWEKAPRKVDAPEASASAVTERLLRAEVEDHLERSQRVLVDLVNADDSLSGPQDDERLRAADLVAAGRLYRQSAAAAGDVEMRDLLEDVERVLVDVANGPSTRSSNPLTDARARISEQDLLFRVRLAAAEIREQERRARPTW
jgi:anti-sigma factor RsiW